MKPSRRVLLDLTVRSVALLVLSETVAALYAAAEPNDDGLGAGLTVMFALVCAAAGWGLWDGFHRSPVGLCVTWVTIGLVVSIGTTLYSQLRYGDWSWAELARRLVQRPRLLGRSHIRPGDRLRHRAVGGAPKRHSSTVARVGPSPHG